MVFEEWSGMAEGLGFFMEDIVSRRSDKTFCLLVYQEILCWVTVPQ